MSLNFLLAEFIGKISGLASAVSLFYYSLSGHQLLACNGKKIRFYTGLSLLNSTTGIAETIMETTDVIFRDLSKAEIENYIVRAKPLHCAGSFNAEGLGIALFKKIIGTDPNSLIGVPLIQLVTLLQRQNYSILPNNNN